MQTLLCSAAFAIVMLALVPIIVALITVAMGAWFDWLNAAMVRIFGFSASSD